VVAAALRLRFEVYCNERQFLDARHYPHGLEADEYDPHSLHFVGIDDQDLAGGTLRLVRNSARGFPLERQVGPGLPEIVGIARDRTAEVSRLVLAKRYRGHSVAARLMRFGLVARMYEEARRLELDGLLAAMERGLWRLLASAEICFEPVGPPVSYFGQVVPYYAELDALERGYKRILDYEETHARARHPGFEFVNICAFCVGHIS
jgi:N-acyl-L-homoserine lactone synthetase